MRLLTNLADKTGVIGSLTAAMGCANCFPALGSLASALGLGFLAQFEGIFINTLLPVFAALALLANSLAFYSHKICYRFVAAITGPCFVLLTLYPLWSYSWSTYLLYSGIALMILVSVWDVVSPTQKVCSTKRALPAEAKE